MDLKQLLTPYQAVSNCPSIIPQGIGTNSHGHFPERHVGGAPVLYSRASQLQPCLTGLPGRNSLNSRM